MYRLTLHAARGWPNGHWWWALRARNGKTLAHSENYTTRRAALQTARRLARALGIEVEDRT